MINYCPYCGCSLSHTITRGITSCNNCCRVFDSSPFNRLLSAGWMTRHRHYNCPELLMQHGYTFNESKLVIEMIHDKCYRHEDYIQALNDLKISKDCEPSIDAA